MGKCFTENIGSDILIIKTGINLYRTIPFFLCIMTLMMSVCCIVLDSKRIIEMHASFFISLACLLLTIFMDKLVYVLKFPTNYLIVSKKEIVYKMYIYTFSYTFFLKLHRSLGEHLQIDVNSRLKASTLTFQTN